MSGADTTSFLPALSWSSPNEARVNLPTGGAALLPSVMSEALREYAGRMAEERQGKLISVNLDFTGETLAGGEASMHLKTDRKTRSLIFVQASLYAKQHRIMRATAIFKLV